MSEVYDLPPEELVNKDELQVKYLDLQKRVADGADVTLDELKNIVVPWLRIHREITFNTLGKEKEKKRKITKRDRDRVMLEIQAKMLISDVAVLHNVYEWLPTRLCDGKKVSKKEESLLITVIKHKQAAGFELCELEINLLNSQLLLE